MSESRYKKVAHNLRFDRKSRKYVLYWRDPTTGKQRSKTQKFGRRRDAITWRNKTLGAIQDGDITVASRSTRIADLCDEYIAAREAELADGNLRTRTVEKERWACEKHIKPRIGRLQSKDTGLPRIRKFNASLKEEGLAPSSQSSIRAVVSLVLDWGVRQGYVGQNPFRQLDSKDRVGQKRRRGIRVLTTVELDALIEAAGLEWRAVLFTIAHTGARASESLGLGWADIDFEARRIRIDKQMTRTGSTLADVKTSASERYVPMSPALAEELKAHRKEQFARGHAGKGDLVFTTSLGTSPGYWNLRTRGLKRAADKVGLEGVSLHGLRHTFGSHLVRQGIDVATVSRYLGHSDPSVLLSTYSHEVDHARSIAEDAERVGAILSGGR